MHNSFLKFNFSATPADLLAASMAACLSYLDPLTSLSIDGTRTWNRVCGKFTVEIGKIPLVSGIAFAQCEHALRSIHIKKTESESGKGARLMIANYSIYINQLVYRKNSLSVYHSYKNAFQ